MPDHYKRWLSAKEKWREQAGDLLKPPEAVAKELRESTIALLKMTARGDKRLPGDVAFELAEALTVLEAGQDETFLLPSNLRLSQRKQPLKHPFLEGLRLDAVRYLNAVANGEIEDRRPKKTVALAYGVSDRTVRRWHKDDPEVVGQGAVSVTKSLMRASGKQYQRQTQRRKEKT